MVGLPSCDAERTTVTIGQKRMKKPVSFKGLRENQEDVHACDLNSGVRRKVPNGGDKQNTKTRILD